jgi:hypothetical protein
MAEDVEVAEGTIGMIGGPGSVEVMIRCHLADLRRRLGAADHPLATVPQWNGDSFYLVHLTTACGDRPEPYHLAHRVMLIGARTPERASEVAAANARSRDGPDWSVSMVNLVELTSNQLYADLELG